MEEKFKAGDRVQNKNNRIELIVKYYDEFCGHTQTTKYVRCSSANGDNSEGSYSEDSLELIEALPTKSQKEQAEEIISEYAKQKFKFGDRIAYYGKVCKFGDWTKSFSGDCTVIYEDGRREIAYSGNIVRLDAVPNQQKSILQEAEEIVNGSRANDYGNAVDNFKDIAKIASVFTRKELSASDCCKVMMAVKIARESYRVGRDNKVDLIGYIEILNRIEESNA